MFDLFFGLFRNSVKKWHPDRCARNPAAAAGGEAKRRFQQIQEAYSVLSDRSKRSMYDAGLYDPNDDDDENFSDFMQEMISMMNNVKDEGDSFEDLQRMFAEMVGGDGVSFDLNDNPTGRKRPRGDVSRGNVAKR
ncbi:PREDICTED: dnaJ homolog subfamily B member 6-like isoform X2 [Tarenaya hassleriana]|uniref:dnaJ homolog subfamily B member 6-like isoform X2 n=1 Tax=Tarenaya hassleriana TaxID=28532 RepID=UPI00053C4806|nr:PREDICTED: dnaJ homolog subfamily B member 6-like isoform X2 [Tarenaya hassleriana]